MTSRNCRRARTCSPCWRLPDVQRAQVLAAVDQRFAALGGAKALRQGAARATLAEYTALGMDTQRLQNNFLFRVGGQMLRVALVSAVAAILIGLLGSRIAGDALFRPSVRALSGYNAKVSGGPPGDESGLRHPVMRCMRAGLP